MSLNQVINPTRYAITSIVSSYRSNAYFVDNSFQRRLVWTNKQKARLIETILMGYPMPEIYLWEQSADPESGQQKHSIVDGQQRITSIVQFMSNEWSLKKSFLDEANRDLEYADKFWKDLSAESKKTIWEYIINIRVIPNTVNEADIRLIFKRLNETDKSLNPQELRNAEFNGEFIKASEEIANNEFWKKHSVFSDADIRRMVDINLSSSLLIALRRGIVEENASLINDIYDSYNNIYEEKIDDLREVFSFMKTCDDTYFSNDSTRVFFSRKNNIYILFCVHLSLLSQSISSNTIKEKLDKFVEVYNSDDATKPNSNQITSAYKIASSSRTTSKSSRDKRVDNLLKWILGEKKN